MGPTRRLKSRTVTKQHIEYVQRFMGSFSGICFLLIFAKQVKMLLTDEKEAEAKEWVMKRLEDMYV